MSIEIRNRYTGEVIYTYGRDTLQGADLRSAFFRGASLMGASLSGANLRHANLRHARLDGANISGANISGADIRGASLIGTDLREADLRGANISGADIRGAIGLPTAPAIPRLDAKILEALKAGGELDMSDWHMCETTHCIAGWAVHLAGDEGKELEDRFGPQVAGALIYAASGVARVPDFYATADVAMAELRERAAKAPHR